MIEEEEKPRRFVRMFKPEFADKVKDGSKKQTIRPLPKRMPILGDIIDCRMWAGKPRQSKHVKLIQATITEIIPIKIIGCDWIVDGKDLEINEMEKISKLDGFDDFLNMACFFEREYKTCSTPFEGIIIKWK